MSRNEGDDVHDDGLVLCTCNEFTLLLRLNKKSHGHELILAVPVASPSKDIVLVC